MSRKWRHEIDKTPCANCGHPRNEHRIRHPSYPDIYPPGVWCPEPRGGKQYAAPDPGPADYFICVKECARAEIEAGPDGPTAAYARSITPEVRAALRDALPKLFNLIPVVGPMLALIVRLVVEASADRRAKADPLEHAAMTADRSTYHPAMAAALDGRLPIGPEEDDDRPRKETPQ
jgi:hypothetical protein